MPKYRSIATLLQYADNFPLIWNNFSEFGGYVTALVEEQPGIFTWNQKGFQRQPVDIYLRPFGFQLLNQKTNKQEQYCIGNQPEIEYFLNAMKKIVGNKNFQPFFLTSFLWKISHDYPSEIEKADTIILKYFQQIHAEGVLENTISIVFSDHGNRFNAIRQTLIGRWEERMPFIAIYLPPRFQKMYPAAAEVCFQCLRKIHFNFNSMKTDLPIFG